MDAASRLRAQSPLPDSGGFRARAAELLTGIAGPPASLRTLRRLAVVRLTLALPVLAVPTGLFWHAHLPAAHALGEARGLAVAWAGTMGAWIALNLLILCLDRKETPPRLRIAGALTYGSIGLELLSNQTSAIAVGSLLATSSGAMSLGLVVMYRAFTDFRFGLCAMLTAGAFTGLGAALELGGVLTPGSGLPVPLRHSAYAHVSAGATLAGLLVGVETVSFFVVNFAVNQSVKLHRYITDAVLARYLPRALVQRAAHGALLLDAEPERRVVTVLFSDLVGFTALSERLGADAVGQLLNRYLSRLAELAHLHGATIDKFVGDAIMVFFGAPESMSPRDQARRAVCLAIEMHALTATIEAPEPLRIRIGINTGEVVVGSFGSLARSDYTVVGPAVNLAARLETASEPGRILVGAATALLLDTSADLEPVEGLRLKGVTDPVTAYYVPPPARGPIQRLEVTSCV